jgi:hypothetical protein
MDLTKLARRPDPGRPDCGLIYCDDVHVGEIAKAAGRPNAAIEWQWRAGFYPGSRPGDIKTGTAPNFEVAKAAFRKAWLAFAWSRTEADFQALRVHIEWTRRKYKAIENGER